MTHNLNRKIRVADVDEMEVEQLPDLHSSPFYQDVVRGLSGQPKRLPSKYFYDLNGSRIFEKICELDEYYLTRAELSILDQVARDVARRLPELDQVVEFGSGNCHKVQYLLDRHEGIRTYVPIDVSHDFLIHHADRLMKQYQHLQVTPLVGDFLDPVSLGGQEGSSGTRMGFFPGSTIGNLDRGEAIAFLQRAAECLGADSYFLVGVDTLKSEDTLIAAYDDGEGVTRDFNLNLLHRMRNELGADVDIGQFSHEARFNVEHSRIEMHLRSECEQEIRLNGDVFPFQAGETIHTENSHKYRIEDFHSLAREGGWEPEEVWLSAGEMFSVHLLKQ